MPRRPTLADIQRAHNLIADDILRTPVLSCEQISERLGAEVFFKCENFQKAGAFKSRGACHAVRKLADETAPAGVVTHSSGNHAAALARAAALRGIPAHIVMPSNAPRVKVDAVQHYGGHITFCEPTLAARETTAAEVQSKTGATLIHPYDDLDIIAGQGTAAVEFLQDYPELDVIMAPVGGGGLLSGTAIASKSIKPTIQVLAGEPANADDAYRSWQAKELIPVENPQTIADGLRTSLGALTFPIIGDLVDQVLLASEEAIVNTQKLIMERMKIVIEPSSAVPLAALLESDHPLVGKRIGIILTGGNVDLNRLPFVTADEHE